MRNAEYELGRKLKGLHK